MTILLSEYLASLSPTSSGRITILWWVYLTETFNNNFGINCFSELLSIDT